MASEWRIAVLGDLTINHDGKRKPVKESDRRPGPYPYYGASGIVDYVDGYLFDGEYLLVAEDGENLRTRQTPIAFMARGKSWVNNHAHVLTGNDKADTRFLVYAIEGTDISGYLTGAVMPKLTQGNLNKIELNCPPLAEQRAIVHILGTLDDKIELNRRQNETLEAMARALFKAWFVDFEPVRAKMEGRWQRGETLPGLPAHLYDLFPGRLVESELGEIPEGWEVTSLAEFSSLNPETWTRSTRPKQIHYVDLSNTKWGRIESVANYDADNAPSRAQRVLRPLDTIVGTVRPGNGSYAMISDEGLTGSTGFAVLRPVQREFAEFIYLAATARENIERLSNLADGGAYPAVRPEIVSATQVPRAGKELINEFSRQVSPMLSAIADNERVSRTLAQLRDTLLPKLISGELRIADAEAFLKGRG
ncbi:restriction endonuclease subunit S [Zestomonas thermotolerans]|uniref:restriction endonuclease subunit S n=1 Tax=Zestomonas thermotolerans TaxID=157784 RepID=UPI0023F4A72E|nr:restriction endonuclease subunit S [Pseudomonas thermotolerans]